MFIISVLMVTPASSTVTFCIIMLVHIFCSISGFNTHCGGRDSGELVVSLRALVPAETSRALVKPLEVFVMVADLVTLILPGVVTTVALILSVTLSVDGVKS